MLESIPNGEVDALFSPRFAELCMVERFPFSLLFGGDQFIIAAAAFDGDTKL